MSDDLRNCILITNQTRRCEEIPLLLSIMTEARSVTMTNDNERVADRGVNFF